ncbi:MAG: T9SS type A sorting domain-containing protein [Flavobacteriaceae bacterium]
MKKIYISILAILSISLATNAQVELEDGFETYTLGDVSAQAAHWRTWSGNDGGIEDADVTSAIAANGSQSLSVPGDGAPAGVDQLLTVPSLPNFGTYSISWNMYVPTGKGAYFNMQAANTPSGPWTQALMGGNVYFNCDGASGGSGGASGAIDCSVFDATFSYPENTWFNVKCVYDIDAQTWKLLIDDALQFADYPLEFGTQVFAEIAAIDFYAVDTNNEFYLDDVVLYNGDITLATESFETKQFSAYPNPVTDKLNIQAKEAISSVVIYNVLGQQVYKANVDALSSTIDMSRMASGAYFVKVNIGGTEGTVKVIK